MDEATRAGRQRGRRCFGQRQWPDLGATKPRHRWPAVIGQWAEIRICVRQTARTRKNQRRIGTQIIARVCSGATPEITAGNWIGDDAILQNELAAAKGQIATGTYTAGARTKIP